MIQQITTAIIRKPSCIVMEGYRQQQQQQQQQQHHNGGCPLLLLRQHRQPQRQRRNLRSSLLLFVLIVFAVALVTLPTTNGFITVVPNSHSTTGSSTIGRNGPISIGYAKVVPFQSPPQQPFVVVVGLPLTSSNSESHTSSCFCRSLRFPTTTGCRTSIHNVFRHTRMNRYTATTALSKETSLSLLLQQPYGTPTSTTTTTTTALPLHSLASGSIPPSVPLSWIQLAIHKFRARPGTYLFIPIIAAFVGWFTNWLAVQMIFYPIQYRGLNLYRPNPENPLGFLGWQGIIPCKTRPMSNALVDMVTTQLLTVSEAFGRIDPKYVATALSPSLLPFTRDIVQTEVLTPTLSSWTNWLFTGPNRWMNHILLSINTSLLEQLTKQIQLNAEQIFQLRNCVVNQMMDQRSKLGELFQECGKAELNFLTNSGLWFGFLLGIVQMLVALVWDNPWSLSIGGGIVGLATNWLALKWIFEPVDPIQIGPFLLQGKFLRRQTEVAATFAQYFSNHILSSRQIWNSMLTDPQSTKIISNLLGEQIQSLLRKCTFGLWRNPLSSDALKRITDRAIQIDLPNSVPIIFPYMDQVLKLEQTLRIRMERMTSRQFERVLHPIFEEDELTLIIAGAVLGFGAGLIQQGLEMNIIRLPKIHRIGTIITTTMAAMIAKCRGWLRNKKATNDDDDDDINTEDV